MLPYRCLQVEDMPDAPIALPGGGLGDTSRGSSSCKSLYPEDPATLQDPAWRTSRHVETKTNFFVGCEGERNYKKNVIETCPGSFCWTCADIYHQSSRFEPHSF